MKIGFIGLGNMGKAIIEGLLTKKAVKPMDIIVHSAHVSNYQTYADKFELATANTNLDVAKNVDVLVLAVKPELKTEILTEVKPALVTGKVAVLSLLTGVSLADLAEITGSQVPFVRVMPNLNVRIGAGITAIAANKVALVSAAATAKLLFSEIGEVITLPEQDFSTFVALAGSAPAFAYLFMDALAHAGVKYGLSKAQSLRIVSQMVVGSAQLIQQSGEAPWNLIDQVSSPGGTTIAGVLALQEAGFETAITKAVDAMIKKDLGE
ncbi:pyrroline-5-carboxylate reductase [Lapidilactobacillus bayanensis]|uniref:pyrroline-5-carboxylate reductase n=1 Tax=Lapidilactobacillus bayanensis TaxID=2485998 RepID=UPI000F77AD1B|nr:pyrroline-5-carboxylate reductase [Lapidilactobacillus bayanensis]